MLAHGFPTTVLPRWGSQRGASSASSCFTQRIRPSTSPSGISVCLAPVLAPGEAQTPLQAPVMRPGEDAFFLCMFLS